MEQGRLKAIVPPAIITARELAMRPPRPVMGPPVHAPSQLGAISMTAPVANGTPIATLKKLQTPSLLQMRMSSNGVLRPPSAVAGMHPLMANGTSVHTSPSKSPLPGHAVMEGATPVDGDFSAMAVDLSSQLGLLARTKSGAGLSNGYPLATVNGGYPAQMTSAATYIAHAGHNGVPPQPMPDMKSAFSMQDLAALQAAGARPGVFPGHPPPNGPAFNLPPGSFNLKLPPSRQSQWVAAGVPRPGDPVPHGSPPAMSAQAQAHAMLAAAGYVTPARTPSAAGMRGVPPGSSVAQLMQGRASPMHAQLATAQSLACSPHMGAATATPLPGPPGAMLRSPHAPHVSPRAGPSPVPPSPSLSTVQNGANGAY
jgi:hypothetical protein